jgi:hypothetical protein
MKQPDWQASGQDGSRSPACHSGNKLISAGGRQGPSPSLPFLYTAAQNALGISVRARGEDVDRKKRSGSRYDADNITICRKEQACFTLSCFCGSSRACEKKAGINSMPACVSELAETAEIL